MKNCLLSMAAICALLTFCKISHAHALSWSTTIPLPCAGPNCLHAVTTNNNFTLLYLFGNLSGAAAKESDDVYQFDGMNYAKVGETPQLPNNVAVFQYTTSINDIFYVYYELCCLYGYNTTLGNFENPLKIPVPDGDNIQLLCLTSNDTHLFLVQMYMNEEQTFIAVYDVEHPSWIQFDVSVLVSAYANEADPCVYYQHNLYVIGCFGSDDCDFNDGRMLMAFNDESGTSKILPVNLTYSAFWSHAIMPHNDGRIYVIGGGGDVAASDPFHNNVNLFDANACNVTALNPLNTARNSFSIGFMKGEIYVFGGQVGRTENEENIWTNSTEKSSQIPTYSPTSSPTSSPSAAPTLTKPTHSPTHRHGLSLFVSEQDILYSVGVTFVVLLCCLVGIRCCKRIRDARNRQQHEGRLHPSVAGIAAPVRGQNVMDTCNEH